MFSKIAKMLDEKIDSVLLSANDEKYYNKVMSIIGAVLVGSLLTIIFSVLIVMKGTKIEPPSYYLVNEGKVVGRLPVLGSPSGSTQKLSRWSGKAIREVFTFNFENIDGRLRSNAVYFTPDAYQDFMNNMVKSKEIERIKGSRLYSIATLLEKPELITTGVFQGKKVIRVEAPVVMTLLGGEAPVHKKQWVELYLVLVPPTESPEGVLIMKMNIQPYE